jgi:hypothetical protein
MKIVFKSKAAEFVKCEACAKTIHHYDSHTDGDGFTGCRPCFPVSNAVANADRFLHGPCSRKNAAVSS